MYEMSTSRLNDEEPELSAERKVRSILKALGGHEATMASRAGLKKKVRFALQEPDHEGHDRPRKVVSELQSETARETVSTMRSAHDTQPTHDRSTERVSYQLENVHTKVPETSLRHKSKDGTVSSRTVMRYDATLPEAATD